MTVKARSWVNRRQEVSLDYAYDNANRLTGITQGSAEVSLTYDNANRGTSVTLPNGIIMNYSYDDASQLTEIVYEFDGSNSRQ